MLSLPVLSGTRVTLHWRGKTGANFSFTPLDLLPDKFVQGRRELLDPRMWGSLAVVL